MRKAKLKTMNNTLVQLWPPAKRIDCETGMELPAINDRWHVIVEEESLFIGLARTGHGIRLPYDHIREYMEDGCRETNGTYILKAQLYLSGNRAWFTPLL